MKKLTLILCFLFSITIAFCQDKQAMGGCEYSINITPPNIILCHINGPPYISCEDTIYLCPNDSVKLNMTYVCAGGGTTYSFQWKNNGVNILGATLDSYTVTDTGKYSLSFYCDGSPGGGWITMGNFHVMCTTSGISENQNSRFHLFPNPVTEKLNIETDSFESTLVTVYNALGEIVITAKLNSKTSDLDLSTLNNGIYFILLDNGKAVSRQKIVKNAN